jgi:hypothetical protein
VGSISATLYIQDENKFNNINNRNERRDGSTTFDYPGFDINGSLIAQDNIHTKLLFTFKLLVNSQAFFFT